MNEGHDSFPSGDDVEDELLDEMSMQDERFESIEVMLSSLGTGLTKEIVRVTATQFVDLVRGVTLSDSPSLPEEQYGRKLYKNVLTMFAHDWGKVLLVVVKDNYPLSRFIDKRAAEISGFTSKLRETDSSAPSKPELDYYTMCAKVKVAGYNKKVALEREEANRVKTRSAGTGPESEEAVKAREKARAVEDQVDQAAHLVIQQEHEQQYVEKYAKFLIDEESYKIQMAEKKNLNAQMERTVVLSTVVEGLRAASNAITSKLKAAAGLHDRVKQKMSSRVVLEDTGEMIDNPFDNNNLSGMMHTLKNVYFTATLVNFNADFQRALGVSISKEDASKNPMKAVTLVEKNIATWATMNYWEYMTPDIFWTNILLRTMPASEFQTKCVEHVVWYVTQKENGDIKDDRSRSGEKSKAGKNSKSTMPIYDNLRDFIQRAEDSGRHKTSAPPGLNPQPHLQTQQQNHQYGAGKPKGNVENAHAALTELFTAQVGREKDIKCKDVNTGIEFPYTATAEVCTQCFGKSAQFHKPRCYTGTCKKCLLIGHRTDQCKQDPSSYKKS